ncbi:MAG: hypothetical protein WAU54_01620, partial [Chania sp.]
GFVDPSNKSGSFGETVRDVYRPDGFRHTTVSEGFIIGQAINLINVQTSGGARPPAYGIHPTLIPKYSFSGNTVGIANRDEFAIERFNSVYNVGSPTPSKFLPRWFKYGNAVPSQTLWELHEDYQLTPDLVFGTDYAQRFRYSVKSFTPILFSGTTAITMSLSAARCVQLGMVAFVQIDMAYSGDLSAISQTGGLNIQGFPYPILTSGGNGAPSVTIGNLHSAAVGIVGSMSGTTLSLKKNHGAADLTKSDLLSTGTTFIRLTVMYRANFEV